MQRYYVDYENINILNNEAFIDGEDFHHIKNVMRMKIGEKIILLTNDKKEYLSEIVSLESKAILKIVNISDNNNELDFEVVIAQGLVRKEKSEEVLRRLVELGARGYLNVSMERSVVKAKNDDDKINKRRNTIIKECSEQAERGLLMESINTKSFKEFINYSKDFDLCLVCYEESGRSNDKTLKDVLRDLKGKKILALIGPEGGISERELKTLKENRFILVGLGKRILRTETAPLYLMSVIGFVGEIYE